MNLFSPPSANPALGLLQAESAVLTALASGAILQGSADDLIRQLEVGPGVFRAALHDLVAGGWIYATTAQDGRLTIGRERRTRDVGPPGPVERRRPLMRGPASLWEHVDPSQTD